MTDPTNNPAHAKLQLRHALREIRGTKDLTQQDVATDMDWSVSKVIRIESGGVRISITDLEALLRRYHVTDGDEVARLVALARVAKQKPWWEPYRADYDRDFLTFLDLEEVAKELSQVQVTVVPGLLQTADYARTLMLSRLMTAEQVDRGATIRERRQERISADGPKMFFILDEAVLHRQIGDYEVMRGQLEQIKEFAMHPKLSIQIFPFSAGVHPDMRGSFEIVEFSDASDDYALLLEDMRTTRLIKQTNDETGQYVSLFAQLQERALSKEETPAIIDDVLRKLKRSA